jgi:transcriptional regulator with XRE-family HTH domain
MKEPRKRVLEEHEWRHYVTRRQKSVKRRPYNLTPTQPGTVGALVQQEREKHCLTQSELAKIVGITQSEISRIERCVSRNPGPGKLAAILRRLGIPRSTLAILAPCPDPGQDFDPEWERLMAALPGPKLGVLHIMTRFLAGENRTEITLNEEQKEALVSVIRYGVRLIL